MCVLVGGDFVVSNVILAVVDDYICVDIACSFTSAGVRGVPVVMIGGMLVSLLFRIMVRVTVMFSLIVSLSD